MSDFKIIVSTASSSGENKTVHHVQRELRRRTVQRVSITYGRYYTGIARRAAGGGAAAAAGRARAAVLLCCGQFSTLGERPEKTPNRARIRMLKKVFASQSSCKSLQVWTVLGTILCFDISVVGDITQEQLPVP